MDWKKKARLFHLMGHPLRLKILSLLSREERQCVCRMVPELGVPQPTLSRHLALLKSHGLIEDEREGAMVFYQIADPTVTAILSAAGSLDNAAATTLMRARLR